MKLAIGNDHAAVELKFEIMEHLKERGIEVVNVGTDTHDRFNYPVAGYKVAKMVAAGEVDGGVLICGTGVGISLSANKVKGIRCALCADPLSAEMTRRHNDANMLAMGAGIVGPNLAERIVEVFLNTEFEGGRHARRVGLITEMEK